jgi:hypothetical protein
MAAMEPPKLERTESSTPNQGKSGTCAYHSICNMIGRNILKFEGVILDDVCNQLLSTHYFFNIKRTRIKQNLINQCFEQCKKIGNYTQFGKTMIYLYIFSILDNLKRETPYNTRGRKYFSMIQNVITLITHYKTTNFTDLLSKNQYFVFHQYFVLLRKGLMHKNLTFSLCTAPDFPFMPLWEYVSDHKEYISCGLILYKNRPVPELTEDIVDSDEEPKMGSKIIKKKQPRRHAVICKSFNRATRELSIKNSWSKPGPTIYESQLKNFNITDEKSASLSHTFRLGYGKKIRDTVSERTNFKITHLKFSVNDISTIQTNDIFVDLRRPDYNERFNLNLSLEIDDEDEYEDEESSEAEFEFDEDSPEMEDDFDPDIDGYEADIDGGTRKMKTKKFKKCKTMKRYKR